MKEWMEAITITWTLHMMKYVTKMPSAGHMDSRFVAPLLPSF